MPLYELRREGEDRVVGLLYRGRSGFWLYEADPADFRRNDSMDIDWVATDSRFDYNQISVDQARVLITQGIGVRDPRMRNEILAMEALSVDDVFGRVARERGH